MAGAGKRTFIAGEVLTAAQVNDYLMDQAVMRFSGSAARAASITAPTEGMVTYLDDANRLEIYDGSAWQQVPTDQDDLRNLVTGSAQVLIGAAAGSVIAVGGALEGQVLTAASAQPGGAAWVTPSGAGAGAWANVTASGTYIGMTQALEPGFYKITTNSSLSYTSAEFRFATTASALYGASLTNGAGFFSMPVETASIIVTKGAPMTVLIEEIPSLTTALPVAPTVQNLSIHQFTAASFDASLVAGATGIGGFFTDTGSFQSLAASVRAVNWLSSISASPASVGTIRNITVVQRDAQGLWGPGTTSSARFPFEVFTANGTYTTPAWATRADIVVVAGGGSGGYGLATGSGGGGAGGVLYYQNVPVSGSYSASVGAGGSSGANGSNSAFGASVATGGGRGGIISSPSLNGVSGGSGGGGAHGGGTAGTGVPGQGNAGAAGNLSQDGGGGGGYATAGAGGQTNPSGGNGASVFGLVFAGGGGGGNDGSGVYYPGTGADSFGGGANANNNPSVGTSGRNGVVIVRSMA